MNGFLGSYWWTLVIANIIIGILWVKSVRPTSFLKKIIMIITGVPGYAIVFLWAIADFLIEMYNPLFGDTS